MPEDVSGNFRPWLERHYRMSADNPPGFICRRCGAQVNYLTKHAAEAHQDDIEVMPVLHAEDAKFKLKW